MAKLPRPFDKWTTYEGHGGIDYGQPMGKPIPASGPGRVDFSGWYSDRGGWAKFVTYDNGVRCGYYHLRDMGGPGVGQRVAEGTTIGYVGSTGHSTGPHLHHEVWIGNTLIKPPTYWNYIDQARYVGDGKPSGGGDEPFPTPTDQEYPSMFLANCRNGKQFWLCLAGEPAVLLGANSGARESGIPVLNFPDDWAVTQLKAAFPNIT